MRKLSKEFYERFHKLDEPMKKIDDLACIFCGYYNVPIYLSENYFVNIKQCDDFIELNKEELEDAYVR